MSKKQRAEPINRSQERYVYVFGERATGKRQQHACFAGGAGAFAAR